MKILASIGFGLAWLAVHACAQPSDAIISPPKGFQPSLTYQIGDFESINIAYGSVSLRFPMLRWHPVRLAFGAVSR